MPTEAFLPFPAQGPRFEHHRPQGQVLIPEANHSVHGAAPLDRSLLHTSMRTRNNMGNTQLKAKDRDDTSPIPE